MSTKFRKQVADKIVNGREEVKPTLPHYYYDLKNVLTANLRNLLRGMSNTPRGRLMIQYAVSDFLSQVSDIKTYIVTCYELNNPPVIINAGLFVIDIIFLDHSFSEAFEINIVVQSP